ncbi:MAG: baseplate J/gp47 family protein [Brevinema sp.]
MSENSISSKFSPQRFKLELLAQYEKTLAPGEYYPEDILQNTVNIMAIQAAQLASYAFNFLGADLDPEIATGTALDRCGQKVGINERYTATFSYAELIIVREEGYKPVVIPAGTEFSLDGIIFESTHDLAIDQQILRVRSIDIGSLNIMPREAVLVSPIVGITAISSITFYNQGRNTENDEEFRIRVLNAYYQPVFGDYINQLQQEFTALQGGQQIYADSVLTIYPIFPSLTYPPYGIPDDSTMQAIQEQLSRLITFGISRCEVIAPSPVPLDITVMGLVPNTVEIRTQIIQVIRQYFESIRNPGANFVGWQMQQLIGNLAASINNITPSELKPPINNGEFFVLGNIHFIEVG